MGISLNQLYYATATLSWYSCTGTVVRTEVEKIGKRHSWYRPSVSYDYIVDGHQYTGHKYRWGGFVLSKEVVNEIIAEYPVGGIVNVYYSPNSPQQSVLVPGRSWGNYVFFVLGLMVFLLGLWFLSFNASQKTGA